MTFFKKQECLDSLPDGYIVANKNITQYFHIESHQDFIDLIQSTKNPHYFEYISDSQPVKLFFDIEIYPHQDNFSNPGVVVESISSIFGNNYFLLESHCDSKKSFHMIYPEIHYRNVTELKSSFLSKSNIVTNRFIADKVIDTSVYRSGLFRTVLSSKPKENRPLVISEKSPLKGYLVDTFVTFGSPTFTFSTDNDNTDKNNTTVATTTTTTTTESKKVSPYKHQIIENFIRSNFNYKPTDISEIILHKTYIIIALKDKFCGNINREHKSNHQYIVVNSKNANQRCHDPDCKDFQKNEISIPIDSEILDILRSEKNNIVTSRMLEDGKNEGKVLMDEVWNDTDTTFDYDKILKMFYAKAGESMDKHFKRGTCIEGCQPQHCIVSDGFYIKCTVCQQMFPGVVTTPDKYTGIHKFFLTINNNSNNHNNSHNNIRNLSNSNNVNGVSNTTSVEREYVNCQIDIDEGIFNDPILTKLYNDILDGHKITSVSELLNILEKNFIFSNDEWWYMFKTGIWKKDIKSIRLLHRNISLLSPQFNRIITYYKGKQQNLIIKNVSSLITKLSTPSFQESIVKGARVHYIDDDFFSKLDAKKHLVPCKNGVYNLLEKKFRQIEKKDYISMTLGYDYNPEICNQEVHQFINDILPEKDIRDYVLKKMSESLNADIPNTHFIMFIGNGANGKSQLLNLMKLAMGEFAEKIEVTLLTRKRNDATSANSEKIKLRNKRFAFLSEPEDGESFNVSLLKEMTGSEEIVARGLYKESVTFQMEAKLFLGCNELPTLKGEDTALWRRIRVVNFNSKFVENPKEENEYNIDITLPSRMKADITWRQTFLNILLEYYYKSVPEPQDVTVKTKEYAQDNNEYETWFEEHIVEKEISILQLKDLAQTYYNTERVHSKMTSKIKLEFEKYIQKRFPLVGHECKKSQIMLNGGKERYNGWLGLCIN
jgi:P4 family phage/plasmid primase-like protien